METCISSGGAGIQAHRDLMSSASQLHIDPAGGGGGGGASPDDHKRKSMSILYSLFGLRGNFNPIWVDFIHV